MVVLATDDNFSTNNYFPVALPILSAGVLGLSITVCCMYKKINQQGVEITALTSKVADLTGKVAVLTAKGSWWTTKKSAKFIIDSCVKLIEVAVKIVDVVKKK